MGENTSYLMCRVGCELWNMGCLDFNFQVGEESLLNLMLPLEILNPGIR